MLVAAGGVLAACSQGSAVENAQPTARRVADPAATTTALVPAGGGTLRIGATGIDSLDPASANPASASSMLVADLLYDGLTSYDPTKATVVGALASSWGVSADGLTWTFEIDPKATFADGTPVKPADVKATLERVAARGDASVPGVRLAAIVGYDEFVAKRTKDLAGIVAGSTTVQFRLAAPFAALAELLADPVFGVVSATDAAAPSFPRTPRTSGAFALTGRTDTQLSLTRTAGARASLDAVELRAYPDADAAYAAFGRGDLDAVAVPAAKVDAARTNPPVSGATVVSAAQQVSAVYGMNVAAPALAKVELRQAILRAVNRDAIRAAQFPGAATMTGLVGPGAAGRRDNACGTACGYDVAAAKALVATAYPKGGVPEVHVDYFTDAAGREAKMADAIAADLRAVGIPATPRAHTVAELGALVASGGAELFRYGWIGSYPSADAYLAPFERRGVDNVFSLDDEQLSTLVDQARKATSDAARTSAYAAIEDRVFALAPVLPLAQYKTSYVATAAVRDLVVAPSGSIDFLRVHVAS